MNKVVLLVMMLLVPLSLVAQEITIGVTNDSSYVLSGGVNESGVSRTLVVAGAEYDFTEKLSIYVEGQLQRGEHGSADTGDIQAYSNIDEEDFSKLYEIWVQGHIDSLNLRFKVGQVDANSEFAYVDHSGEFINSSMGFSPTISFFPTYPNPTASMNLFFDVSDKSQLAIGMYSDESNEFKDTFYISEWALQTDQVIYKLGAWHQTGSIERLDVAKIEDGVTGYYFAAEGELSVRWLASSSAGWFTQIAFTDDKISEINKHVGTGIVLYNTFGREGDIAGGGLTYVDVSKYLRENYKENETSIEIFYKYQLNQYVAIKPNIQYIINPAADKVASDALVFTLRTEIGF